MDVANTHLVIIPGWGGTKKTWRQFVSDYTNDGHSCEVVELPCFGDQPCPSAVWGVEEYASFLTKRLKTIAENHPEKQLVLLGHSFGGQVSCLAVSQDPSLVQGLIFSGAAIIRPKRYLRRAIFGSISKVGSLLFSLPIINNLQGIMRKFLYKIARSPDYLETQTVKRRIFQKVIRQDVSDSLISIEIPTLLLWGEHDSYVPLKYGKKIAKLLPNSTLSVVEGGTHGLHIRRIDTILPRISDYIATL